MTEGMSSSVAVQVQREEHRALSENDVEALMLVDSGSQREAPEMVDAPTSQRRRVCVQQMPYVDRFEVVDCGGGGDCGFTTLR
ncbi:MAG: hypothetical protein ACKPKO_13935, partial [Candidatus Fonsibacter sp.]